MENALAEFFFINFSYLRRAYLLAISGVDYSWMTRRAFIYIKLSLCFILDRKTYGNLRVLFIFSITCGLVDTVKGIIRRVKKKYIKIAGFNCVVMPTTLTSYLLPMDAPFKPRLPM